MTLGVCVYNEAHTIVVHLQAGEDIIEALCSNSVTFAEKTEFAQEKYKKRKARKYMTSLTLRKPTAWTMCEVGNRQQVLAHLQAIIGTCCTPSMASTAACGAVNCCCGPGQQTRLCGI